MQIYDLEDNNSEECYESLSFEIVWICYKLYIKLFHMLNTLYLSVFFSSIQ